MWEGKKPVRPSREAFMTKRIEEYGKDVAFAGFRDVCLGEFELFLRRIRRRVGGTAVQFFDADLVAGWEHLYFAVLNALKAFESGRSISKNLAVECLLYASAQPQISSALELIGIKGDSSRVAVVVVADGKKEAEGSLREVSVLMGGKRDDGVFELSDEKLPLVMRLFGISDVELRTRLGDGGEEKKALSDLVIEHIALLAVQR
jgi:tRNA threonylcarbamoyladenosine modification (KEOPS) complex Cgi121 subunit